MKHSRSSRRSSGFAIQTLIFWIATVGITATATVAIIEAYQKWIEEPRTPSELKELTEKNNNLQKTINDLEAKLAQSDEEQVHEAAQVLRLTAKPPADKGNSGSRVTEAMKRRGLSDEENKLLDQLEDGITVNAALKQSRSSLNDVFSTNRLENLRNKLPSYQKNVEERVSAFRKDHPQHSRIIDERLEEARGGEVEAER